MNAIAPGIVATEGTTGTARLAELESTIPMGRVAAPDDIAAWAWALAGDRPLPYITGETVLVTGGVYMR